MASPPSLQEAARASLQTWQTDLQSLFTHAKDRFPDVVWDPPETDVGSLTNAIVKTETKVYAHKAVIYARAPPSFQQRYFSNGSGVFGSGVGPSETDLSLVSSFAGPGNGGSGGAGSRSRTPMTTSSRPGSPLLRLRIDSNHVLFENELEYLYTGQGFGEAFEFLFDCDDQDDDLSSDEMRIDKLRKDLVFMWRSRLYSDIRIALEGPGSNSADPSHENTTAIFSSHRFILVSRAAYFHNALVAWPKGSQNLQNNTLTLPSPPFTPASLHFTLGFIYTGTLSFSHRSYDLTTSFHILLSATYLSLQSLYDEIQARIVQEMCHGLFHAFLEFSEYESLTGGKWGPKSGSGCTCKQCARRIPRVLEFSLRDDVKNKHFDRGARRALVGMFGEGWVTQEWAGLDTKLKASAAKGVAKRTVPLNVFALLWAAEAGLKKIDSIIKSGNTRNAALKMTLANGSSGAVGKERNSEKDKDWPETVRPYIQTALSGVDKLFNAEPLECFTQQEWLDLLEADGVRFEDGDKIDAVCKSVVRGLNTETAVLVYQVLISQSLLLPPSDQSMTITSSASPPRALLSTTSHIYVQVDETRLQILDYIRRKWMSIREAGGFHKEGLEGWAVREVSDLIEVPLDELLSTSGPIQTSSPVAPAASTNKDASVSPASHTSNLPPYSPFNTAPRPQTTLSPSYNGLNSNFSTLTGRPRNSQSGVDHHKPTDSAASSMKASSFVTHSSSVAANAAGGVSGRTTPSRARATDKGIADTPGRPSSRSSVASRHTVASRISDYNATIGRSQPRARSPTAAADKHSLSLRPDSKLTPANNGLMSSSASTRSFRSAVSDVSTSTVGAGSRTPSRTGTAPKRPIPPTPDEDGPSKEKGKVKQGLLAAADDSDEEEATSATKRLPKVLVAGGKPHLAVASPPPNRFAFGSRTSPQPKPSATSPVVRKRAGSSGATNGVNRRTGPAVSNKISTPSGSTLSRPSSRVSTASSTTSGFRTASAGSTRNRTSSVSSTRSAKSTHTVNTISRAKTPTGSSPTSVRRPPSVASTRSTVSKSAVTSTGPSGTIRPKISRASLAPSTSTLDTVSSQNKKAAASISRSASGGPTNTGGRKTPTSSPGVLGPVRRVGSEGTAATGGVIVLKNRTRALSSASKKDNKETTTSTPSTPQRQPKPLLSSASSTSLSSSTASSTVSAVPSLKKKGSSDTIKGAKSSSTPSVTTSKLQTSPSKDSLAPPVPPLPASIPASKPQTTPSVLQPAGGLRADDINRYPAHLGTTLDIGIPCIISSKRKRFKALAKYIGQVEGELGFWVGVEVPMSSLSAGSSYFADGGSQILKNKENDDRQWNDGSWGGVRYFSVHSSGGGDSMSVTSDAPPARRRRLENSTGHSTIKSTAGRKRGNDTLAVSSYKRMRNVSPSGSERSDAGGGAIMDSRGLFVRPSQVLYVVDAIDGDL